MTRTNIVSFTLIMAGLFAMSVTANADPFTDLNSSGAGPANYAVLGLGGGQINLSLVTVNGNIGIGSGGTIVNMAPSVINGNVFEANAGQYSGPGKLNGSITTNSSLLSTNVSDAQLAASDAAALSATQTFGTISSSTTITGGAGLNVIRINGNINLNNANLILSGPSSARFVIDVTGNLSLVGNANLLTSGGVSDSDVLYNFTSSNASINTHVNEAADGIFLAAGSGSNMTLDGTFNGELIGNQITLMSGAIVNSPPPVVPEPSSFVLLGTAAGVVGFLRYRRQRRLPRRS